MEKTKYFHIRKLRTLILSKVIYTTILGLKEMLTGYYWEIGKLVTKFLWKNRRRQRRNLSTVLYPVLSSSLTFSLFLPKIKTPYQNYPFWSYQSFLWPCKYLHLSLIFSPPPNTGRTAAVAMNLRLGVCWRGFWSHGWNCQWLVLS